MGLEPTTFCMAIVCTIRINAWFCGVRVNPIPGDYRRFSRYWSLNGPPSRGFAPSSRLDQAAVDHVVGASHVRGPLGREHDDQRRELLRGREAAAGNPTHARNDALAGGIGIDTHHLPDCRCDAFRAEPEVRRDRPWRDRVDADAARPELLRERLRQVY